MIAGGRVALEAKHQRHRDGRLQQGRRLAIQGLLKRIGALQGVDSLIDPIWVANHVNPEGREDDQGQQQAQ